MLAGILAVPVLARRGFVVDLSGGQHRDLVGIGIDGDVVVLGFANNEILNRFGSLIDKAVSEFLPCGEGHKVALFQEDALLTKTQRDLAFKDQKVFFFVEMIVERRRLLARRQLLNVHAKVEVVAIRVCERLDAPAEVLAPGLPRDVFDTE